MLGSNVAEEINENCLFKSRSDKRSIESIVICTRCGKGNECGICPYDHVFGEFEEHPECGPHCLHSIWTKCENVKRAKEAEKEKGKENKCKSGRTFGRDFQEVGDTCNTECLFKLYEECGRAHRQIVRKRCDKVNYDVEGKQRSDPCRTCSEEISCKICPYDHKHGIDHQATEDCGPSCAASKWLQCERES